MTVPDVDWKQLDRRTVIVSSLSAAGVCVAAGVPAGIGFGGGTSPGLAVAIIVPVALVIIAAVAVGDYVRWRKTRYRVLADRVQLNKGIVVRSRRSLSRERIRSVDLTAGPLLRYFGLVNVKIGTGEQTEAGTSSLMLNPVTKEEAERLRTELLDREPVAESPGHRTGLLAQIDLRWIRFAPMSFLTPTLGVAAFGAVLQASEWFGLQQGVISWTIDLMSELHLVVAILVLIAVGMIVGVIGSSALFVEMWWQFRLEREPGGTLRVRRGLLTSRSISLEEKRLRGVELVEPLGNRLVGAARIDAVATGLVQQKDNENSDHKTLLPAAPKDEVDRVAADVLREEVSPTSSVRLAGHPVAARGRRIRWGLASAAAVVMPLLVLGWVLSVQVLLHLAWISAVVLVPVSVVLAIDAYRNLGHGITGDYLVARSGSVRRGTVALQRRGVIGLTARQSIFQRRKGLITLTATTAAGAGAYSVHDVGESEGLAFADTAVPDLFGPFLERR
ncbi:PH domain-containing protein [Prauserella cavernicola]|uniref:PH domain-containing protein n=1 Tax=Prauserella cavernicola TaxID=2800127 RepID=A0A934QZJ7_9PSEU|nr:PH domain-containing protein [Prauserella cavernicola]MBK1789125.1 PH domain-containing protein [Prauserella cavernicola]